MARSSAPRDCPCSSGLRYRACCGPLHEGDAAPTPEALMRSRYSAFALGLGTYLFDTLAMAHPDRKSPRDGVVRELARVRERQRFMGLTVLHTSTGDRDGEVLFVARIFARGQDLSFGELSRFVREEERWRYEWGLLVPRSELPRELAGLDREGFLRIAAAHVT